MSTIRQKAKAAVKPEKKVVQPVLTSSLTLQWPELSNPAQAQIEAALWDVLKPLAVARESQYQQDSLGLGAEAPPEASTSKVKLDTPPAAIEQPTMPEEAEEAELQSQPCAIPGGDTEQIATLAKPVTVSKRAKHRAHLRAKVEKRSAHLPPDTHEVRLRSGKSIQIPDRLQPEAFIRKIRLDKNKALANRPEICQSLVIGLNAVTRYLEDSLEAGRCELSGRPYPNDAAFGSRTAATHLRLSVPTPNHGTRRDRRALKERIRPGRSAQKQKLGRSSKSATVPRLPPYLVVPRSEPILPFMLQEIQARLKNESGEASDAGVFLDNIESMAASLEDQKSTQNAPSAECKGSSAERALQQGVWQIPSDLVDAIVFSAGQKITEDQNRDRSMLLALLMRCDPGWFQAWRQRDEWQKRLRKSWEQENPGIDTPKATSINPLSHSTLRRPLRLVFVAKADINPVHLVQHLLTSVSANNSLNLARRNLVESSGSNADGTETIDAYEDIYLVPLPKGAEERLATLLALRRVSVLAFTDNASPDFLKLLTLVKTHIPQTLKADWLVPAINASGQSQRQQGNLVPTHVKLLQTTGPTDIKALRAERQAEKKRKREAAQERSAGEQMGKRPRSNPSKQSSTTPSSASHTAHEQSGEQQLIGTQPMLP